MVEGSGQAVITLFTIPGIRLFFYPINIHTNYTLVCMLIDVKFRLNLTLFSFVVPYTGDIQQNKKNKIKQSQIKSVTLITYCF